MIGVRLVAQKKKPKKQGKQGNPQKPRGHYCWVCGQHKPNEKFSGRGHANHICKKCQSLPVAERNEISDIRKVGNMAFRHLSEKEIKWLRDKMNDPRPAVREAAIDAHNFKFPRYGRNMIKKGKTAFSLELFIRGEVWNEWGDEKQVHMLLTMDNKGKIRRVDNKAPTDEHESEINIEPSDAKRFLKSVIHDYDALFWDEDLSDAEPGEFDPYLDILLEYRPDYGDPGFDEYDIDFDFDEDECDAGDDDTGPKQPAEDREPIWSLCLELNNGEEKRITFYNQMHQEPQELFWALMEWFEPDDEFEDDWEEADTD